MLNPEPWQLDVLSLLQHPELKAKVPDPPLWASTLLVSSLCGRWSSDVDPDPDSPAATWTKLCDVASHVGKGTMALPTMAACSLVAHHALIVLDDGDPQRAAWGTACHHIAIHGFGRLRKAFTQLRMSPAPAVWGLNGALDSPDVDANAWRTSRGPFSLTLRTGSAMTPGEVMGTLILSRMLFLPFIASELGNSVANSATIRTTADAVIGVLGESLHSAVVAAAVCDDAPVQHTYVHTGAMCTGLTAMLTAWDACTDMRLDDGTLRRLCERSWPRCPPHARNLLTMIWVRAHATHIEAALHGLGFGPPFDALDDNTASDMIARQEHCIRWPPLDARWNAGERSWELVATHDNGSSNQVCVVGRPLGQGGGFTWPLSAFSPPHGVAHSCDKAAVWLCPGCCTLGMKLVWPLSTFGNSGQPSLTTAYAPELSPEEVRWHSYGSSSTSNHFTAASCSAPRAAEALLVQGCASARLRVCAALIRVKNVIPPDSLHTIAMHNVLTSVTPVPMVEAGTTACSQVQPMQHHDSYLEKLLCPTLINACPSLSDASSTRWLVDSCFACRKGASAATTDTAALVDSRVSYCISLIQGMSRGAEASTPAMYPQDERVVIDWRAPDTQRKRVPGAPLDLYVAMDDPALQSTVHDTLLSACVAHHVDNRVIRALIAANAPLVAPACVLLTRYLLRECSASDVRTLERSSTSPQVASDWITAFKGPCAAGMCTGLGRTFSGAAQQAIRNATNRQDLGLLRTLLTCFGQHIQAWIMPLADLAVLAMRQDRIRVLVMLLDHGWPLALRDSRVVQDTVSPAVLQVLVHCGRLRSPTHQAHVFQWKPSNHHTWPEASRQRVMLCLLMHHRHGSLFNRLPRPVLHVYVLPFIVEVGDVKPETWWQRESSGRTQAATHVPAFKAVTWRQRTRASHDASCATSRGDHSVSPVPAAEPAFGQPVFTWSHASNPGVESGEGRLGFVVEKTASFSWNTSPSSHNADVAPAAVSLKWDDLDRSDLQWNEMTHG